MYDARAPSPGQASQEQFAGHWQAGRPPFVGREAERRQLQSAFEVAVAGEGGLVTLVGEPGIGKTALCEQLATFASNHGGQVLVGHCFEEGSLGMPYQPFVEALSGYVTYLDAETLRAEAGAGASDLARIVPAIQELLQLEASSPTDPRDDRLRLFNAVLEFIRRAAAARPLLLVVEDLHDADRGTLDLLLFLARNLAAIPLMVVGTYRDVAVDREHPLSAALGELRRVGSFGRIHLSGLSLDDVHRLLITARRQSVPRPLAELVHRRTEGNPLFAHEMLRLLLEEGLIDSPEASGSDSWRASASFAGHIPEGLRDVVGKRLSRLSARTNQLLSIASVIGREFQLELLQRVSAGQVEELEAALEEAAAAGIVEERAVEGATVRYRFAHAFFRQTLYEEMLAPRRIRLHQVIARALEEIYSRRLDDHSSELAEALRLLVRCRGPVPVGPIRATEYLNYWKVSSDAL